MGKLKSDVVPKIYEITEKNLEKTSIISKQLEELKEDKIKPIHVAQSVFAAYKTEIEKGFLNKEAFDKLVEKIFFIL